MSIIGHSGNESPHPHPPAPHVPPPTRVFSVEGTTVAPAGTFTSLQAAYHFAREHFPNGNGAVTITARGMGLA